VIAETKHLEALRLDYVRALRIRALAVVREMLTTIKLNHELCGMTNEVGDVALDRYLTPKPGTLQTMIAQL